jgi:hypothetical protein
MWRADWGGSKIRRYPVKWSRKYYVNDKGNNVRKCVESAVDLGVGRCTGLVAWRRFR